ncbi:MAG TPA: porin [Thermoanaerobaculia bacterium]|nr:porin [Thermoanaerobaculia bacterium]
MVRRLARAVLFDLCLVLAVPAFLQAQTLGVTKPAGKEPTLILGGLVQVQAEFGDRGDTRFGNDNDRFYLRRARLNAAGKFLEEFDFRVEGDFAGTLSNTSALRAQLTDGYLTWNRYPEANVRMGQFKTPFGFEQLYSDPRLLLLERSLANDRLTLSRQLGVQVGGDLFEKRLSYAVGAFNGNGANNNFNDDDSFLTTGRLSGVLWQGKLMGQSAAWSLGGNVFTSEDTSVSAGSDFGFDSTPSTPDRDGIFAGERIGTGFDTQVNVGRFDLWAEYLDVQWEPTSGRPSAEVESDGLYVQGSYYLIANRLQLVLKAESFDPVVEDSTGPTEIGTAGLSWHFKAHDMKFLVNYLHVRNEGQDDQGKLLARMQVIF